MLVYQREFWNLLMGVAGIGPSLYDTVPFLPEMEDGPNLRAGNQMVSLFQSAMLPSHCPDWTA